MRSKQYGSPERRGRQSGIVPILAGFLLAASAWADGPPERVGGEFKVDSGPVDMYHDVPNVVVGEDGNFAVVWHSYTSTGSDTSRRSVQWRRFDAGASPLGDVEQVNTYTTEFQERPAVAVQDNGDFLVVWESDGSSGSDSSGRSIQGQRYDSLGQALGSEFQVNSVTSGSQALLTTDTLANGDVIAIWTSPSSDDGDTSGNSIQGQRFDSQGLSLGTQFQVNAYTTGGQTEPSVEASPDGGFVVAWTSTGSVGSDDQDTSIQAQRFDSAGQSQGSQFQVNAYTTGIQNDPDVSVAQDGTFLVVWEGRGPNTGGFPGIHGQLFDATGQPQGGAIEIAADNDFFRNPAAAAGPGAQHLVTWSGRIFGVSGSSINGQVISPDGSMLDSSFQVETTSYYAYRPTVDSNRAGEFVVAWHQILYPQTSGYLLNNRIDAQRFVMPMFEDGFESGNTAAWSDTVP